MCPMQVMFSLYMYIKYLMVYIHVLFKMIHHQWGAHGAQYIQVLYSVASLIRTSPIQIFQYTDTCNGCLGTNPQSSTESDSLIRKFSYPDSQSGNGGVRISEVPLYIYYYFLCVWTFLLWKWIKRFKHTKSSTRSPEGHHKNHTYVLLV